jgi:hypothetical protein
MLFALDDGISIDSYLDDALNLFIRNMLQID